jgi:hypothetical protein
LIDRKRAWVCGLVLLLAGNTALAEEPRDDDWHFLIAPYLWVATIDGELGAKGNASFTHLSFSDIVEHLDMGYMIQMEAHKGAFGFLVGPLYLNVSDSQKTPAFNLNVELKVNIIETLATWQMTPGLELLAGGRYTRVQAELGVRDTSSGVQDSRDASTDWWDPVIGARYMHDFDDRWSVAVRGDVGGQGGQSDFVWDAFATVGYRVGASGRVYLGYRCLDYDYTEGNPPDRFTFNIRILGPVIGYGMTF